MTTTTATTQSQLKSIMDLRDAITQLLNGACYGGFGLRATAKGTAILEGVEAFYTATCAKAAQMHSEYMAGVLAAYKAENEARATLSTRGSMEDYTSRGLHPRDFA